MNLLCPNCQKMLTVPDNSAGQTMRCPLCTGTFTVPSLPSTPALAGTAVSAPPPSATPPVEDIFRVSAPPEPTPPKREEPIRPLASPELPATAEPSPPSPPGGATGGFTLTLNPQLIPWIAPVALAVVFILLFLPWTGALVQGEKLEWYTQSGWSNAFGNGLAIVHILLFLLALPISIAVVTLPILEIKLPAQLDAIWPWRAVIVSGLVGAATLFLVLHLIMGVSLESEIDAIGRAPDQHKENPLAKKLKSEQERQVAKATVYPTTWLRLAVVCHLLALAGLGLHYWLQQRGNRPSPRVEITW